ncbi:hypothetical protein [Streptomyces sp. NPDC090135]|uniref:DUF11 domain-containing protein n=1 Tax=Streptomyces sp. NPDC090135 TaxID=3365957 RepID=UPI00380B595C
MFVNDDPGTYAPQTGAWSVGKMPIGARAALTLRAKAVRPVRATDTAVVTATEKDPDPADDTDSVAVRVEPAPACRTPRVPRARVAVPHRVVPSPPERTRFRAPRSGPDGARPLRESYATGVDGRIPRP